MPRFERSRCADLAVHDAATSAASWHATARCRRPRQNARAASAIYFHRRYVRHGRRIRYSQLPSVSGSNVLCNVRRCHRGSSLCRRSRRGGLPGRGAGARHLSVRRRRTRAYNRVAAPVGLRRREREEVLLRQRLHPLSEPLDHAPTQSVEVIPRPRGLSASRRWQTVSRVGSPHADTACAGVSVQRLRGGGARRASAGAGGDRGQRNPRRWTTTARDWQRPETVTLNPERLLITTVKAASSAA